VNQNVDLKSYDKILLDHVVFYFKKDAEGKAINAEDIKELSDAFHKSLVEALSDGYPFVDRPGPGVMRVRIAITDVEPGTPGLDTITAVVPVGLVINTVKLGATGESAFVGEASVEVEILDSRTNQRLAAAIDERAGAKYKVHEGFSKWGHVKGIFKFWAKRMRKFLDEARGK
jgi:hypothetical protein